MTSDNNENNPCPGDLTGKDNSTTYYTHDNNHNNDIIPTRRRSTNFYQLDLRGERIDKKDMQAFGDTRTRKNNHVISKSLLIFFLLN